MKDGALKILFVSNGIFVLATSLLGPLYALYVEKINKGILNISVSWAVFLISATIFTFIISKIGDHHRKDGFLITGYLIRAVVWIMYIFVSNMPQLILLQILLGLGEAIGTPTFDAIFAEHLEDHHHVEEYSDWSLIRNISTALGTIGGGLVVSSFGFKPLFIFMAFFALISVFGIAFRPKKILLK